MAITRIEQDLFYPLPEDLPRPVCITADPPYGNILNERWDRCDATDHYLNTALIAAFHLPVGGSLLMWGGVGKPKDRPLLRAALDIEDTGAFYLKNWLTWSKKRAYGKADNYLFTREELLWFVKGPPKTKPIRFNIPLTDQLRGYAGYNEKYPAKSEYKRRTNVWTDVTEILRGKKHPAEKPAALYEIIYSTHSDPRDVVWDLYPGSGNAGVAADKLGRDCVLIGY